MIVYDWLFTTPNWATVATTKYKNKQVNGDWSYKVLQIVKDG